MTTKANKTLQDAYILVVDDEECNRTRAKAMLLEFTNNIDEAKDGEEAIGLVKVNLYDLILMDLMMPTINGFKATKIIRSGKEFDNEVIKKHYQKIPIIAHTSCGMSVKEKAIDCGMSDLIVKPCQKRVLIDILEGWI